MRHHRQSALVGIVGVAIALGAGCTSNELKVIFTEPALFPTVNEGERIQISAEVLTEGRESYVQYCYACHGMDGKGDGPAAPGLRPPPRNLQQGLYKFGGVVEGLPHDDDFVRIIVEGLDGSAMLPWDIPPSETQAIVHYIKTFAEIWQDEDEILGKQIPIDTDPWGADKTAEAVARGEKIYHGLATCQQCHAAYATKQEIYDFSSEVGNKPITEFRPDLYYPELKESQYTLPDERKVKILPPEFMSNPLRSGYEVSGLYRIIASGVPGTAMPAWYGALDDKDIWAMAYYVKHLVELAPQDKGQLRKRLMTQPEFVPPAPKPPPAPPADPAAGGEEAGAAPAAEGAAGAPAAEGAAPAAAPAGATPPPN